MENDVRTGGRPASPSGRWTLSTSPATNTAEQRLVRCLQDERLWLCYLKSLAERPDLSILNLATVAIKRDELGYRSCVDMRSREAWSMAGADLRRGVTRHDAIVLTVPRVTEDGTTEFEDVEYWTRDCVIGAPATVAHAPSLTYDLRRPSDIGRLAEALATVNLDELPGMSVWAVYEHFGFPTDETPTAPSASDIQSARRLLAHVSEQAQQAIGLVERALKESQAQRLRQDEEMVERAQRDAMRLRSYTAARVDRPRDLVGPYGPDPQGHDASRRPPAMPQPRKRSEAQKQEEARQEPELTILEEKPKEPPPVLPLEVAVEQVRAKLFPKGKK